jgi:hypothetical protein
MGWCQAFGEHEVDYEEKKEINWLYGEAMVGMALEPRLRKTVYRELLRRHKEDSRIILSDSSVEINQFKYVVNQDADRAGVKNIIELLKCDDDIHLFLTSHFCYPQGPRIITFSKRKPLFIMYKEIEPLAVRVF